MKYIIDEVMVKSNLQYPGIDPELLVQVHQQGADELVYDEAIRVSHPDSWDQKYCADGGAGFGDLRRRYVAWDPSVRHWRTIPENSLVVFTKDDKRQFRFFRACFQQARKEAAEKRVSLWGTLKDYFELKKVLPL